MYRIYHSMLKRCYNPNEKLFYRYGERGIRVCERWLGPRGYDFFCYDMGERPEPGLSIDRIDFNGNYCPENCRWATSQEQNRNTVRNRMIEIDGVTKCLQAWAEESPVSSHCIAKRLRRGWSGRDAVFTPESNSGVPKKKRRELGEQVGVSAPYNGSGPSKVAIDKRERIMEIDGVKKPLLVWCQEIGAKVAVVRDRLKRGWTDKDALLTPTLGTGQKRPGIRRKPSAPYPVSSTRQ